MTTQPEIKLPPLPTNVPHVTRRIQRTQVISAAEVVLEHFASEYARAAVLADRAARAEVVRVPMLFSARHALAKSVGTIPDLLFTNIIRGVEAHHGIQPWPETLVHSQEPGDGETPSPITYRSP